MWPYNCCPCGRCFWGLPPHLISKWFGDNIWVTICSISLTNFGRTGFSCLGEEGKQCVSFFSFFLFWIELAYLYDASYKQPISTNDCINTTSLECGGHGSKFVYMVFPLLSKVFEPGPTSGARCFIECLRPKKIDRLWKYRGARLLPDGSIETLLCESCGFYMRCLTPPSARRWPAANRRQMFIV